MNRKKLIGAATGVLLSVLCISPAFAGGQDVGHQIIKFLTDVMCIAAVVLFGICFGICVVFIFVFIFISLFSS